MCTLCQARDPSTFDHDPHAGGTLKSGAVQGVYDSSNGAKPIFSNDQIADYLTDGFWGDTGRSGRSFDVETGGTITYNINGLDAQGKTAALQAMESWTAVSGLKFEAAGAAMIIFDDNQSGAYNSSTTLGDTIITSRINVDTAWRQYGDYYLQTYIHEIGHAIGLGHTGDYNGSASYSRDAHFANDSWQASVMSYFDQNENTAVNASRVFLATAQLADIVAVQNLYGAASDVRTGNTVYGDGENTGQFGMDLPSGKAVAILDNGGIDHINLGSRGFDQTLNLNDETYSDLNGRIGNFSIARGTLIENATTGAGDDFVTGNAADNIISTGAGSDTIFGNGGNDTLFGGDGADLLTGGSGADSFAYSALSEGGDTVVDFALGQGDRMDITALLAAVGYNGVDPVGDGVVRLEAGNGGSYLVVDPDGTGGSAGTQIAFLTGIGMETSVTDVIATDGGGGGVTGGSNDTLYRFTDSFALAWTEQRGTVNDMDGGTDTIDISGINIRSRIYLDASKVGKLVGKNFFVAEETVIENLILGQSHDTGVGNTADNTIDGQDGNDKIYGLAGADHLMGGMGRDRLYGGEGDDLIDGGDADDRSYGDAGNDALIGGFGRDKLYGGAGDDDLDGGEGDDNLYGMEGHDTIAGGIGRDRIDGGTGDDVIRAGDDSDRIDGGAGNDVLYGGGGTDVIDGDAGDDQIYGGDGSDRIKGADGNDTVLAGSGADRVQGGNGDDNIIGGSGLDRLYGGNGNDEMSGDDDADLLYGDKGEDLLYGGGGRDRLFGGTENDVLYGGTESDTVYSHGGDDILHGDGGDDRVDGDRGNDTAYGGDGNDRVDGGTDDDLLYGDAGIDDVSGEAGDDVLYGGSGADELDGGTGDDILYGGSGDDLLIGGSGNDRFAFGPLDGSTDTIRDFNLRNDSVDVSLLLADLGKTLADAVTDGTLALAEHGRGMMLKVDVDGDAGAEEAVDLVYIQRMDEETRLDDGWLV